MKYKQQQTNYFALSVLLFAINMIQMRLMTLGEIFPPHIAASIVHLFLSVCMCSVFQQESFVLLENILYVVTCYFLGNSPASEF